MPSTSVNQRNKEAVWDYWQQANHAGVAGARGLFASVAHPDIAWHGPHPLNELHGIEAVEEGYLGPLLDAFDDLRRDCDVFLGSHASGEDWVSSCGYLAGTFTRDWLGIPATGKKAHIHYGEHLRLEGGRIVESYLILDLPSLMRQSGYSMLPPSLGTEGGRVIGPPRLDGVLLTEQDPLESAKTRQLVWAMHQGIRRYDGTDIASMAQQDYWHPDMHWYGPTGIGACYGLEQYREFHERPWTEAFPDDLPATGRMIGLADDEQILAEGNYGALGVWDCQFAVHRKEYLGIPATGKRMRMRDFDWYRRDGRWLVQNWVPIDLIDIALQMGRDVMAELAYERERRADAGDRSWTGVGR